MQGRSMAPPPPTGSLSLHHGLSDDEVGLWVRDGYLIKRGVLDPTLCSAARERLWELNQLPGRRREEPASWIGPFRSEEEANDAAVLRKNFSWRARACGREELLLNLLPRNRTVVAVVEALLGRGAAVPPERTRGIYAIMPHGERRRTALRLHNDSTLESRERVSVVGYISDVGPGGGGFGVWPGTHRSCWNKIDHWEARCRSSGDPLGRLLQPLDAPALVAEWGRIVPQLHPVDCHGAAGDVIFYHSRLGHHAGQNYSRRIRQAVLAQFELSAEVLPERELRSEACLRGEIWYGWSEQVRRVAAEARL
eukprot:SAG11_NODE_1849_length_4169_cov_2.639312_1_plen_309_part_00